MILEETKVQFKQYLGRLTRLFQSENNQAEMAELKVEIIKDLTTEDVIDCWILLLKIQGPIEKISDNKYEIYDVSNFIDEISGSSDDYIHTVEFTDEEDAASIFMKFYFVFYCLVNGLKSNEYQITKAGKRSGSF